MRVGLAALAASPSTPAEKRAGGAVIFHTLTAGKLCSAPVIHNRTTASGGGPIAVPERSHIPVAELTHRLDERRSPGVFFDFAPDVGDVQPYAIG